MRSYKRGGKPGFINFLTVSKGSNAEVKSELYRIKDRNFIDENKFNELYKLADEIGSMPGGWISYLNQTDIKGTKCKNRI